MPRNPHAVYAAVAVRHLGIAGMALGIAAIVTAHSYGCNSDIGRNVSPPFSAGARSFPARTRYGRTC